MEEIEVAILGGGCFWCLEAVFERIRGVHHVVSGYAGGHVENPTYEQVCSGYTGHAEVVQLTFDPKVIDFDTLLYVFWRIHDPTTLNRQGADIGTQYRSIILYHTEVQRIAAEKSKAAVEASGLFSRPIVTEIAPLRAFYPAETYHQKYYQYHRSQPYCLVVIDPKIAKLRQEFRHLLREQEK